MGLASDLHDAQALLFCARWVTCRAKSREQRTAGMSKAIKHVDERRTSIMFSHVGRLRGVNM